MSKTKSVIAPKLTAQVELERLEYGKFCVTENGPIESYAEHGVLGFSPGFPPGLREICKPRQLGLGEPGEQSALVANANHGTVLRPVMIDRPCSVCYQIGSRPEGGNEEPGSRHYLVAQYRADTSGAVSPLDFFKSIGKPMGLTREKAQRLQPVAIKSEAPLPHEVASDPFLKNALLYALSGIGIAIDADEAEFFRLADALWHALPPSVRRLFSAGWNIGPSLCRSMMASYSITPSFERPLYRAAEQKWRNEAKFTASDLLPGRMFLFSKFGVCGPPDDYAVPTEALGVLPLLPGLADRSTRSAIRQEGLLQRDHYLRERITEWLAGRESLRFSTDDLATIVSTLLAGTERALFLEWCTAASEEVTHDPGKLRRLLWAIVTSDSTADLSSRSVAGKLLFEWLKKVAAKDSVAALQAFLNAPNADAAPDEEATIPWEQLLNASLDIEECATTHKSLILSRRGGDYGKWVTRNGTRLALFLGDLSSLAVLAEQYQLDAATASTIQRLLEGEPPTHDDNGWLSKLPDEMSRRVAHRIERLWKEQRPVLLAWAKPLHPEHCADNFLKLAAGGRLDFNALASCVEQTSRLGLDAWFMDRLASEVLREVEHLRERIEDQPAVWRDLMELWPPEVQMTVVDAPRAMPLKHGGIEWSPERDNLQARIDCWFSGRRQSAANRVRARAILNAAAKIITDPSKGLSAVDICGAFGRDEFVEGTPLDAHQSILAAEVIKAAGVRLSKSCGMKAWVRANQGWQLRLLLDTCGFSDEWKPTTPQLTELIAHRHWVRGRLAHGVPPEISRLFTVLNYEFHEMKWEGGRGAWYDSYVRSPLWAAFRDLPRDCRGALEPALKAYAGAAETANCCLRHLEVYGDELAYEEVLNAFVIPHILETLNGDAEEWTDTLMAMARGAGNREAGKSGFPMFRKQSGIDIEPACDLDGPILQWRGEPHTMRVAAHAFPLMFRILRDPLLPQMLTKIKENGKRARETSALSWH